MTKPPEAKKPRPAGSAVPSPLRKVFGKNLARARKEAGITQRALAAAGISQRHISLIELECAPVAFTPTCEDIRGGKHCEFWMVPPISSSAETLERVASYIAT